MIIKLERIKLQTRKSEEAVDITPKVEEVVQKSGVKKGPVNILTTHTSSRLLVTEGIPCLEADISTHFSRLFSEDENYHRRRNLNYDGAARLRRRRPPEERGGRHQLRFSD